MLEAIKLIYEIVMGAKEILAFIQSNKNESWFQDSVKVFSDFKQKTPEERQKLAAGIGDLIRRM